MAQNTVSAGLNWGDIRDILNGNAADVETRLAQIETGGVQIISGAGAPSNAQGNNGDYYINSTGYVIYGPKAAGVWPTGVSMSGFTQRGVWSSATAYVQNDVVSYENSIWVSKSSNTNSEPTDANTTNWQLLMRGYYWRGTWVSGTVYRINHLVKYNGTVYSSTNAQFTSTVVPSTDTGNWTEYVPKGDTGAQGIQGNTGNTGSTGPAGLTHTGAYNGATTYQINETVTYRSKLWRRKTVGSGTEPTTSNTTQWELISGGLHWVTTNWATATAYRENDVIKYATDNNLYRAKTNHTSSTAPDVDTTNYEVFLPKGSQGIQGVTGNTGSTGAPGADGAGYSPGFVAMWSLATVPTGWLYCNGGAVSRTTYAALFAIIGTTYGAGDGSTTFNLPDFRGRSPIGDGTGAGLTTRAIGGEYGEEEVGLAMANIPPHRHQLSFDQLFNSTAGGGSGNRVTSVNNYPDGTERTTSYEGSGSTGLNTPAVTPHQNMHPVTGIRFVIKT